MIESQQHNRKQQENIIALHKTDQYNKLLITEFKDNTTKC